MGKLRKKGLNDEEQWIVLKDYYIFTWGFIGGSTKGKGRRRIGKGSCEFEHLEDREKEGIES